MGAAVLQSRPKTAFRPTLWAAASLLVLGYFPVFRTYATQHWLPDHLQGVYTLGPLVVLTSLWLAWRRRQAFLTTGEHFRSSWIAYPILALGIGLKIVADREGFPVLQGLSLIPVLVGVVMVLLPSNAWSAFRFPILYLLFAVPLPPFLLDEVTRPLLDLNTWAVEFCLRLSPFEFTRTAYLFTFGLPDGGLHSVQLVEGCSGIRSLVTLPAVVILYLHLRGRKGIGALGLVGSSILLAGLANVVRILATIFLIVVVGPEAGDQFFHTYSGFLVFAFTLGGVFLLENRLEKEAQ